MEKKSLLSVGGKTYYWVEKNKSDNRKTMFFTHGVTLDHSIFEKQIDFFRESYNIIAWDLPLHGESTANNEISNDEVLKILKEILDTEQINKAILIGMSMGGLISQNFAIENPDYVEAFIGIDTTTVDLTYYSKVDKLAIKATRFLGRIYPNKIIRILIARSSVYTEVGYNAIIKTMEDESADRLFNQYKFLYNCLFQKRERYHFNFPVLIIIGEKDQIKRIIKYSKKWAKKEGYPISIIKNAGHFSNGDNAEEVNKSILEFLKLNKL